MTIKSKPLKILFIATALAASTQLAPAAVPLTKPSPITVDTLAASSADLIEKEIILHGLVDRVSKLQRSIMLIDPSEKNCSDNCGRNIILVTLPDGTELPKQHAEILVYGTIKTADTPIRMTATRILSEPAAVKKEITDKTPASNQ